MNDSLNKIGRAIHLVPQIVSLVLAVVALSSVAFGKRTDDVVILMNGDRMTGEIKSLQQGILTFKAAYMAESVRLDWKRVRRVETKDQYIITLTTGNFYTGSLDLVPAATDVAENFAIRDANGLTKAKQDEVVRVLPLESRLLKQITGTIDYGYSYTSGNTQYQSQLSASANLRRGSQYFAAAGALNFSGQREGDRTSRKNLDLDYRRYFGRVGYAGAFVSFLSSEQQSLDLRSTFGGLVGRSVILTDRTNMSVNAGMVVTREKYTAGSGAEEPQATNAEALIGLDFYKFRFKTTDISSRFIVFPSITELGRYRMSLDTNFRIEIFKDFYVGLNLYENYDSRPPINAPKNDLGLSTSVGWKF